VLVQGNDVLVAADCLLGPLEARSPASALTTAPSREQASVPAPGPLPADELGTPIAGCGRFPIVADPAVGSRYCCGLRKPEAEASRSAGPVVTPPVRESTSARLISNGSRVYLQVPSCVRQRSATPVGLVYDPRHADRVRGGWC
jgi:hypothetical protein